MWKQTNKQKVVKMQNGRRQEAQDFTAPIEGETLRGITGLFRLSKRREAGRQQTVTNHQEQPELVWACDFVLVIFTDVSLNRQALYFNMSSEILLKCLHVTVTISQLETRHHRFSSELCCKSFIYRAACTSLSETGAWNLTSGRLSRYASSSAFTLLNLWRQTK